MRNQHYAGHLMVEGGQLRLRLLLLAEADSPLKEGTPIFDMRASADGKATALVRYGAQVEALLGLRDVGTRITVGDVLGYLASGMSEAQVLADFPDLAHEDVLACLAFAAERERRIMPVPAA